MREFCWLGVVGQGFGRIYRTFGTRVLKTFAGAASTAPDPRLEGQQPFRLQNRDVMISVPFGPYYL